MVYRTFTKKDVSLIIGNALCLVLACAAPAPHGTDTYFNLTLSCNKQNRNNPVKEVFYVGLILWKDEKETGRSSFREQRHVAQQSLLWLVVSSSSEPGLLSSYMSPSEFHKRRRKKRSNY